MWPMGLSFSHLLLYSILYRYCGPMKPSQVMICTQSCGFEEDFLNIFNITLLFNNYLPFKKVMALHLNNLNSVYPRMPCAKLCWNWPRGFGEEIENVKSLQIDRRTDRQTRGGQKSSLGWAKKWKSLQTDVQMSDMRYSLELIALMS